MDASFLARLDANGAALFNQNARLLRLRLALGSGIAEGALLPHRIRGEEGLSSNYRYELDCLSPDLHLELKDLLGQPVEVGILLPEGGDRLITGLVTRAEQRGADDGFAIYRLILEPALATLAHRRNSRVFSDQTVPEIVAALLDEHLASNPVIARSFQHAARLVKNYPSRSYTLQYRESDLAFIERLLAEEGISYAYAHGPDQSTSQRDWPRDDDTAPLHTLVLFDTNEQLPDEEAAAIRFHRTDGVETDDAIDRWHGSREIGPGKTTLVSYDYQAASTHAGDGGTRTRHGEAQELVTPLEDYDPQTGYYGSTPDDMARYAELRQQARDLAAKRFRGEGTVRGLYPGRAFRFLNHPIHDQDAPEDREFLVIGLTLEAENNLLPEINASLGVLLAAGSMAAGQDSPPYRNSFTAVRRHVPIVPAFQQTRHQKPTAHGLTTATVVGPAGEEIFTDAQGRIRIQFHWQRGQDHAGGGADADERSSTWVRVAMPSAGADWGTQYIPRIGQEVVVDFIEGDIDRPLVTGVVYNGTHRPPAFSGAGQLPANKTLSGVKTREYQGSGYNELLFDDSTGQLRTKLSSEHGKTQLNQGFLIHPRTDGKGTPRGEGFELRTDRHGALRAAHGLLLTTEAQAQAGGKQLARDHAADQLSAAYELAKALGETAARQFADTLEHGPETIGADNDKGDRTQAGHLKHHLEALRAWETGTNLDKTERASDGGPSAEAGRQPIIVLSAPAGIAEVTGQNHSISAKANIDQVAGRDLNQTSGRRWLHNVGRHISLFVNGVRDKISLKLIAAQGKIQLQAQHGEMELAAEKDLHITSTQEQIIIAAKKEILLTSGGGYIRIKGGNIDIHCPGVVSTKGAKHDISGPASMNVAMPQFPNSICKDCVMKAAQAGSPFAAMQ